MEISDYLGGRVKKLDFCGKIVEEGAQWLHGLERKKPKGINPIWKLAKKVKLGGFLDDDEGDHDICKDATDNGKNITKKYN